MEDSIYLYARGDRLGSHILQYLSLIIYAFYNNLYIVYEPEKINYNNDYEYEGVKYKKSFFVEGILRWINEYNKRFPKKNYLERYKNINISEYCLDFEIDFNKLSYFYTCDLLIIGTQVLYNIKSDLISYFKKYIFKSINEIIFQNIPTQIIMPFNPKKTIIVHLRMGDVKDRPDYDGSVCSDYYRNRINQDLNKIKGIANIGYRNMQTPLSKEKVIKSIDEAKIKYPEHEVILISQPGNYNIDYPYRCIQNNDENLDLYLLCNADVLILSRSTFALSAVFLGTAREIWCPLWGHFVCTGLSTKYDNSRFNYFY
jgi:hypothetical protein